MPCGVRLTLPSQEIYEFLGTRSGAKNVREGPHCRLAVGTIFALGSIRQVLGAERSPVLGFGGRMARAADNRLAWLVLRRSVVQ